MARDVVVRPMIRTALLLVLALLDAGLALRPGQHSDNRPSVLALRGGVQPALARRSPEQLSSRAGPNRGLPKPKKPKPKKKSAAAFGVRDAVTAALCLTAVGAVAASVGGTNCDPLMAMVPQDVQSATWIGFGGLLSLGLYALVKLTNYDRAMRISAAIGKTVFGLDADSSGVARMLSAPAIIFAVGSLASFQTLPSSAG